MPHPATVKRSKLEIELLDAITALGDARQLRRTNDASTEYVARKQAEVQSAIYRFREACYDELDDEHGLGKAGLDCARELCESATPYHSAHIVNSDALNALREAIGLERDD